MLKDAVEQAAHERRDAVLEIDLHGYHPDDITGSGLAKIIEQAWEMGKKRI